LIDRIQDHRTTRHLDAMTLLTAIAATTERIRMFPDVANVPLRGPVMLARAAATIDRISGGRMELGLGSGAFWEHIARLGVPERTPGQAVAAFEEALDVLRQWFEQRSVTHDGDWYPIKGARSGPEPAHRIGLWVGAYAPRMLGLVGSKADGWLPSLSFLPPEKLDAAHAKIDEAALAAGRDPAAINRIYNVWGDRSTDELVDTLTRVTRTTA